MPDLPGFAASDLSNGIRYVALHYTADEDKQGEWAKKMKGTGIPTREWDREMELREDVWDGKPVFADYVDALHCPPPIRNKYLPIRPRSVYFGGWDCGQTLAPAFVLLQLTDRPFQVHCMVEVVSEGAMSMETFAPLVQQVLMRWHPGLWSDVAHHGDATVTQRSGSTGDSAYDVALRHGVVIKPESNVWAARESAVTWLLTRQIAEDTPGLYISGKGCPILRTGFQGAYRFRPKSNSEKDGAGTILDMPLKDEYSHVQDALQYAALAVRRWLDKKGVDTKIQSRRGDSEKKPAYKPTFKI